MNLNVFLHPVFRRVPRMSGWLLLALSLSALVWALAPQQLPVSVYKLSLIALAAVVGYWVDRSLFPYARPDAFVPDAHGCTGASRAQVLLMAAAMLRRALIVAACMLGVSLGA